ncbi:hypothetical protein J6590_108662 [Homalodisca vitripennis]|nr:hypothetical protein J6590_108662 [Homalodisca vitripennis]
MSQNVFQFQEKYYKQFDGTAMGNPLSCFIANIFLSKFETHAKETMDYFPRIWKRYVDDIFAVFDKKQNLQNFIDSLNSFYPSIKFTCEIENENQLPFLDLLIMKNTNGHFEFDIYRKPTQNDRFIPVDSFHPPSQKRAAFHNLIHRLLHTPLSTENYKKEVKKIKETALFNGYKTNMIDNMIKKKKKIIERNSRTTLYQIKSKEPEKWISVSYNNLSTDITKSFKKHANINVSTNSKIKLKNILGNPKNKINEEEKSGIYQINCDNCDLKYIGQTKRKLKQRAKEHRACLKYQQEERSAMAKHALQTGHSFSNAKLLKEVQNKKFLDAYETIFIKKNQNNLVNNEPGPFQNSPLLYLI